ncbi:hypothetical protein J4573_00835 [Actinomadura barringtoniae]|uniref:Uncharacterized protein n=1 Tax=Actinomadura barringtoniae TaxID=1427535 RepID=A0A939P5N1_9ACTN|nr:hypothetical protein [Actinomadura barringtoniae]MBO2445625.1 hypothetical protein [Actinomadura barringtoniae]
MTALTRLCFMCSTWLNRTNTTGVCSTCARRVGTGTVTVTTRDLTTGHATTTTIDALHPASNTAGQNYCLACHGLGCLDFDVPCGACAATGLARGARA